MSFAGRFFLAFGLLALGLFFAAKSLSSVALWGATNRIDAFVSHPQSPPHVFHSEVVQALEMVQLATPRDPTVLYELARADLLAAEHVEEGRGQLIFSAEARLQEAIGLDARCGMCRLLLAYVRSFLGYPTHVIENDLMQSVLLLGREGYAIAAIAKVASLNWARLSEGAKAKLVQVFAFHLPHSREVIVSNLQRNGVWVLIEQNVTAERARQSEGLRHAFGILQ